LTTVRIPKWTPAILDILKQEGVPGTFFVIGKNGQAYPDLLRRSSATDTSSAITLSPHPNLGEIPGRITVLELKWRLSA